LANNRLMLQSKCNLFCCLAVLALLVALGGCGWLDEDKYVAYSVGEPGSRDIAVARAEGTFREVQIDHQSDDYAPVWSPSHDRIAYLSDRDGNAEVYISSADGSSAMRITNTGVDESQITWAPEGDRIAFMSPDSDGRPRVFWIWLKDLFLNQLVFESHSEIDPAWSPQGKWIAFAALNDQGISEGIFLRNPDGVNRLQLSLDPDRNPVWSPDGKKLAFVSTRDGDQEIYVLRVSEQGPEGQAIRVTRDPASDFAPDWSPDGKRIAFISERAGSRDIFTVSDNGEDLQALTRSPEIEEEEIVWGPDGRIIFLSKPGGKAKLFVTDLDGNQNPVSAGDVSATQPDW
jgi:Tol biopolymer transport system component